MRPATMDRQNMPAPSNSLTISSALPDEAAANEENMSELPFPNASNVIPFDIEMNFISKMSLNHHHLVVV